MLLKLIKVLRTNGGTPLRLDVRSKLQRILSDMHETDLTWGLDGPYSIMASDPVTFATHSLIRIGPLQNTYRYTIIKCIIRWVNPG